MISAQSRRSTGKWMAVRPTGWTRVSERRDDCPWHPPGFIGQRGMWRSKMPQSPACRRSPIVNPHTRRTTRLCDILQTPDGQGRIRTYAGLRQWVYSPSPLAARAPVRLLPGRLNGRQAPSLNDTLRPLSTRPDDFLHPRQSRGLSDRRAAQSPLLEPDGRIFRIRLSRIVRRWAVTASPAAFAAGSIPVVADGPTTSRGPVSYTPAGCAGADACSTVVACS